MKKMLVLLMVADLGLVAVLTAVQRSLITVEWSTQQWLFAVVLPITALVSQATGGVALWLWFHRTRRYRARHAWQARRWIARTSPMVGEPEAVAARLR